MDAQAMELISHSTGQALARIQFYRYLYGVLKTGGTLYLADKKQLVLDFFRDSRVTLQWPQEPLVLETQDCQILCNLILVASHSLLRGGTITLEAVRADTQGAAQRLELTAAGPQVALAEPLLSVLQDQEVEALATPTVQAYYTRRLIAERGGNLAVALSPEQCRLRYVMPAPKDSGQPGEVSADG